MRELSARVRALLRRPAEILPINCLSVGSISLEISTRRVTREGSPVALLPKEFQLFEFLMRHPNQVLTAETLIKRVFPTHSSTVESFRVTMKRLRKKIDPESIHLRNIHGVGYILTAD
jgi:two-component system OmpR family response regulator